MLGSKRQTWWPTEWVYNNGASRHFFANKELMQDFKNIAYGECIYIGNSITNRVMAKEKIVLKLTSDKLLSLSNVLFMSSLHKNLDFGILLNNARLKTVVRDVKVIISHKGVFVGKGHLNGSLFVLSLASTTLIGNNNTSAYITESVDLWHGRLDHVDYASIK